MRGHSWLTVSCGQLGSGLPRGLCGLLKVVGQGWVQTGASKGARVNVLLNLRMDFLQNTRTPAPVKGPPQPPGRDLCVVLAQTTSALQPLICGSLHCAPSARCKGVSDDSILWLKDGCLTEFGRLCSLYSLLSSPSTRSVYALLSLLCSLLPSDTQLLSSLPVRPAATRHGTR